LNAIIPPFQTDKKIVTQDNKLVSAIYKLNLNEKRLLLIAASRINPLKMPSEVKPFVVTADEWLEIYPDSKEPYRDLKRASLDLMKRQAFVGGKDDGLLINWLESCEYSAKKGRVTVEFTRRMTFLMCGFLEQFTSYNLLEVASLKSMYSIRLYENLCRFRTTHHRKWLLDDFKRLMFVSGLYPRFTNLRDRVIVPAVKEINLKTPLNVSYSLHKQGRDIVAVSFKFSEKTINQRQKLRDAVSQQEPS
jgi:plasmid replication initiation protein